jgi:hypothetical protein
MPMSTSLKPLGRFWILLISALPNLGACGGHGDSAPQPITVYLPISTVRLIPGATATTIPIQIVSNSETAQVSVLGLPGGVQVTYAASDTNPFGSLTFAANSSAMTGNSMPAVIVISAGSTASASFALEIQSP